MNIIDLSKQIAFNAHEFEARRGGLPYFTHVEKVALLVKSSLFDFENDVIDYSKREYVVYSAFTKVLDYEPLNIFTKLAQSVAFQHDILENQKHYTPVILREKLSLADDISEKDLDKIIDALEAITKQDNEDYFSYLKRVKKNLLARYVKVFDIRHNLSDNPRPNKIDLYRLAEYYLLH